MAVGLCIGSLGARAQGTVSIEPALTSNGGGFIQGSYGEMYATIGEPFAADSITVGAIDETTWTGFWQITPVGPIAAVREEFTAGSGAATGIARLYPSPFSTELAIDVTLARAGAIDLAVYDLLGRKLGTLLGGRREPGIIRVAWRPEGLPSGSYLIRLIVDGEERGAELAHYYR